MKYDKDKHCHTCEGVGNFGVMPNGIVPDCDMCEGTGDIVPYLREIAESCKRDFEAILKERNDLLDWIIKTSTCKTCKGYQDNTFCYKTCDECGLQGTQPIGG